MGRYSWSNRLVVEECQKISTKFLKDNNFFAEFVRGSVKWSRDGQDLGSIMIHVFTSPWAVNDNDVQFSYVVVNKKTGERKEFNYSASLVWSRCFFGGKRAWFLCPMIHSGRACNRRVGVLYLVGGCFGCRICHNLTYRSSKSNDSMRSFYYQVFKHRDRGVF